MKLTTKMKLLGLGLAVLITAGLVAVASSSTNAYFSDTVSGTFSGTLGTPAPQVPCRCVAGTSTARHWNDDGSPGVRVLPIAQYDPSGAMYLDFGDEVDHNSNASPDVFRLVSLVDQPHTVTFSVSGAMTAFVTDVRLNNSAGGVLTGQATANVFVQIHVPDDAAPGEYTGTLSVHVDGWASDTQLPMTITVRAASPPATVSPVPAATVTPSVTPTDTPASAPTVTPTSTATATSMLGSGVTLAGALTLQPAAPPVVDHA